MLRDGSVQASPEVLLIGSLPRAAAWLPGWPCQEESTLPALESPQLPGRLVVVDAGWLRDQGQREGFADWVQAVARRGSLVVLVHDGSAAGELVSLFRQGLFDAVAVDDPDPVWTLVRQRARQRLATWREGQAIQEDRALTQRLLQDNRRRLQDEAAAEAAALLQAQADLELANQRLSTHMAQVSLLYKFGRDLSLASNWDDTLRNILSNLAEFVGAAGGALVLRAAPGGPYAPRQTYRWQEKSWDKVLLRITRQIDTGVASSLLAPGIFQVDRGASDDGGRITALPLEHQGVRLGMLLLLFADPDERQQRTEAHLSFLQMVQVVLSEEVAAAQMLDRLRDIGAFNTRVLETISSAIWVCDGSGRSIFVNRAARRLLGLDAGPVQEDPSAALAVGRGRLLDRPLTGGAELDDLPEVFLDGKLEIAGRRDPLFPTLLRRRTSFSGEGTVRDTGGQAIPVRVQTAPMAGRGHEDRWLLVILEDLRETKRAEAARRHAEQLEGLVAMSATLAHEIRNPLMGLSAQAELLADSLPADDSRRDRIDLITEEVERINRTITDMLQFVRPCEPRRELLVPATLARACLELARPRAAAREVELRLTAPPALEIMADPTQLKQVLLNLLLNACDAARPGGTVELIIRPDAVMEVADPRRGTTRSVPGVELTVRDDGPGFGDLEPEKLFQPFFTTKTTGTGLGLAYSRKVVDAHGGEIRAERDGGATCMRVLLPREDLASRALAGEAS